MTGICIVHIFHAKWEPRVFFSNTRMRACMHAHTHTHTHTNSHTPAHTHTHTHTHKHTHTLLHIHTHTHTHTYVCVQYNCCQNKRKKSTPRLSHDDDVDAANAAQGDQGCQDVWHERMQGASKRLGPATNGNRTKQQ